MRFHISNRLPLYRKKPGFSRGHPKPWDCTFESNYNPCRGIDLKLRFSEGLAEFTSSVIAIGGL